jgi:hypothetical protein
MANTNLAFDDKHSCCFSIRDAHDIQHTLEHLMPGNHPFNTAVSLLTYSSTRGRALLRDNLVSSMPRVIDSLLAVLDFRSITSVLDPWAESSIVFRGFKNAGLTQCKLSTNMQVKPAKYHDLPKGVLNFHPMERHLYEYVSSKVGIDAVVTFPPQALLDAALLPALFFAEKLVCMYVPTDYVTQATEPRFSMLSNYESNGCVMTVTHVQDPSYCWLCLFHHADTLRCMIKPGVDPDLRWVVVNQVTPAGN